ncbi:transposase [Geomonas sp. RF6]|uniref:REP-associated tyrosine transposase n=1 Tax=Geomonas sp. RF6 TaxID=2897342 RepID=UPI001E47A386|nr:transposase [Geomonas sp. RF6]UFS70498.1 transposase [Geomonas sp. RF6]
MTRPLRIEFEGALYHVTSRGNERKKIFFTKRDYEKFREYLLEAKKKFGFILHCYVLMSNHYHLLIETPRMNLQRVMHYLNGSYSVYTNTKRKRSGHLFQGRYKSIVIDKDSYLAELSRYIHLNPVRAKIVVRPEDYPYSSYHAYVSDITDGMVSSRSILATFGADVSQAKSAYRAFVEVVIAEGTESPLEKAYPGGILGDEAFVADVLSNVDSNRLDDEEVAHRKALSQTMHVEMTLGRLCQHFGCALDEVKRKGDIRRKLCVYVLKKHCGATNKHISEVLSLRTSSSAAKIHQRLIKELECNDGLKRQLQALERALSIVQV